MKPAARALCCLFALLLAAFIPPVRSADAYFEQGDLNGDGIVSAADASMLLRMLRRPAQMGLLLSERADVTQSGAVNRVDAEVIVSMAAGRIPDLVAFVSRISTGLCREALFSHFRYTGASYGETYYADESVSITVSEQEFRGAVCYVADIYIQDITRLRAGFPNGQPGGRNRRTDQIAADVGALIAINGDYFSAQRTGPIVRNGTWYSTKFSDKMDVAVLTWDGEFLTFPKKQLTKEQFGALHPYQSWVFGPRLLDEDGNAFDEITGPLSDRNPRTAIGSFEPGHYCFVVADGRQSGYSRGLTLTHLSEFMASLGCTAAYNLDGGQTSMMATADSLINEPYRDGRPVSDIIYIAP